MSFVQVLNCSVLYAELAFIPRIVLYECNLFRVSVDFDKMFMFLGASTGKQGGSTQRTEREGAHRENV